MLRPVLASALLAAVVLAGCAAQDGPDADDPEPVLGAHGRPILPPAERVNITQPLYDVKGHYEHHFTGTTGTQLYIDYLLPDKDGPVPTILAFTPYQGQDPVEFPGGEGGDPTGTGAFGDGPGAPYSQSLVDRYVPRGYAVAFADVRGNHEAGGCIDQTGPEQWQDGYDYVEWIAAQDWSSGKVGMWGASYVGETQFTTAMMQPPHLTTIVPVASVSNQYEWNFYQGVPYELQPFIGMFGYLSGSVVPSSDPENALLYPEKLECQGEAMGAGIDFSGDMTEFWQERDYRPMADQINVSVLHIHGLRDWNVRPIHVDPLFNDIRSEKRAIFGQWGHAYPDREDWEWIEIAWYDHWLLERENGILDILPPVLIEDDTEQWWGIDSFPPTNQSWLDLELSADGGLVAPGSASPGDVTIHDYPEEALVDSGLAPTAEVGETVLGHPTQAVFTFTTDEELRLVGRPWLEFTATSSEQSTHWAVKLEVDGHECEAQRQSMCQNTGYQDTRHREGLDDPRPVEPGVPYRLRVDMFPQYDVIPAGSTVRLVVQNNDPEVQQDATNSVNTLHLRGEAPAILHLPLAPAQVPLPHDALPDVFPGYAPDS